ncbi:di-heme oxidoredictase family protein [Teredinibacter sp. KSP-S5-2]|uniref:di-heme oxidoredictase family protein n=1 Tax=Teredinibacter sp. KSP-S5-2 TaxID=3034506 RepID=UPI002934DDE5|nr:di-heme oxidoredictase family protein [Teredinibacter sp. KSP-S5-2]WNO10751.1 di-heme oxidoredictase family protein [Teredinibacter sp. KSP-S5-2]
MKKIQSCIALIISGIAVLPSMAMAFCPPDYPEKGVLGTHLEHPDLANGHAPLDKIIDEGRRLFTAQFNKCDGIGRPATTGGGVKREATQPMFIRTSSPETNSCAGCHAQPFVGGSGEFVTNAFILAQRLDPVTESVSNQFSNERNTLGMHGAGAIEMVAREMTYDLRAQAAALPDGEHTISSKGIDFKIVKENGEVTYSEGIRKDLMVRPFAQSGNIASIRHFTIDAMNHHHGMQAEERFDLFAGKNFESDHDEDGVHRELSIGDITALTVFQAALPVPTQVLPESHEERVAIRQGKRLFKEIGCASCHKPKLVLSSPLFSEPSPLNAVHTFNDVSQSIVWDMTSEGPSPRLGRDRKGNVVVRAYTDLKLHNLCDDESRLDAIRFYCNETLDQDRQAHGDKPGREFFLTRKLWDVGSSAPYGHRGDITTITEAILYHGGEGRVSRDNFENLPPVKQKKVVDFLKSLQVVENN